MSVCVCGVFVHVHVCAHMHVRVCVRVHACACVSEDNLGCYALELSILFLIGLELTI